MLAMERVDISNYLVSNQAFVKKNSNHFQNKEKEEDGIMVRILSLFAFLRKLESKKR